MEDGVTENIADTCANIYMSSLIPQTVFALSVSGGMVKKPIHVCWYSEVRTSTFVRLLWRWYRQDHHAGKWNGEAYRLKWTSSMACVWILSVPKPRCLKKPPQMPIPDEPQMLIDYSLRLLSWVAVWGCSPWFLSWTTLLEAFFWSTLLGYFSGFLFWVTLLDFCPGLGSLGLLSLPTVLA